MKNLFITGMGRSGTTLLDKLLTNHRKIDVLSQPLPMIFIEAKKRFLKERGCNRYYVLNDDLISRDHTQDDFDTFLDDFNFDTASIKDIFIKMEKYSGQSTKRDHDFNAIYQRYHGFRETIERCFDLYQIDREATYLGIKEPMCEEFLPYLCTNGYKSIVIIRDPRDVLASANYPKTVKYLGSKKPALFILKTWRKSAEYIYLLRNNKNFHFLRYEDLVNQPYHELDKITEFLAIDKFQPTSFKNGVFDRYGNPWKANTSFELGESFISNRSVGAFKNILSDEEVSYTESICSQEMKYLNYHLVTVGDKSEVIKNFRDKGVQDSADLKADFSSQQSNIIQELERRKNNLYEH